MLNLNPCMIASGAGSKLQNSAFFIYMWCNILLLSVVGGVYVCVCVIRSMCKIWWWSLDLEVWRECVQGRENVSTSQAS